MHSNHPGEVYWSYLFFLATPKEIAYVKLSLYANVTLTVGSADKLCVGIFVWFYASCFHGNCRLCWFLFE